MPFPFDGHKAFETHRDAESSAAPSPLPDEWLYPQPEQNAAEKAVKKSDRNRKKAAIIIAASLVAFMLLTCGAYVFLYEEAVSHAQSGEFSKAKTYLLFPSVTKRHDPQLLSMINAGLLLENGQYMQAESAFAALGDYRNAETMCEETYYRWAGDCFDQGQYLAAHNLFQKIPGYKNTDATVAALAALVYSDAQKAYRAG
ncbi:MAG: hypothetical protein FWC62_06985, partial [Firmicutes bacterium]|nr:hypothetical protein [Bacillota bacterium]